MATAPALCCPPPGPGLHPHPSPVTREPCDLIPRVHWDDCTQEFHAEQITRVVEATNAVETAVAEVEAAVAAPEPEYEYFDFVYNANGDLTSVSRRDVATLQVWDKTLTYVGSNLSTVSAWVLQ